MKKWMQAEIAKSFNFFRCYNFGKMEPRISAGTILYSYSAPAHIHLQSLLNKDVVYVAKWLKL